MARNKVIVSRDLSEKDRSVAYLRDVTISLLSAMEDAVRAYSSFNEEYLGYSSAVRSLKTDLPFVYGDIFKDLEHVLSRIAEDRY